jgi:hypothetical protein
LKPVASQPPIPNVVAMLLCDQIINEAGTNKKSLIGVFDNFFSLAFPTIIQRFAIYVKMADAVGDYLFKLRVVKLKDEALVAEIGIQAKILAEGQYGELALNLGGIPLPEAGKYEIQLYTGNEYLHRIVMNVLLAQPPQPMLGGSPWPPPHK